MYRRLLWAVGVLLLLGIGTAVYLHVEKRNCLLHFAEQNGKFSAVTAAIFDYRKQHHSFPATAEELANRDEMRRYFPNGGVKVIRLGQKPADGVFAYMPCRKMGVPLIGLLENGGYYLIEYGSSQPSSKLTTYFDFDLDGKADPIVNFWLGAACYWYGDHGESDEDVEEALVRQGYWTQGQAAAHKKWQDSTYKEPQSEL